MDSFHPASLLIHRISVLLAEPQHDIHAADAVQQCSEPTKPAIDLVGLFVDDWEAGCSEQGAAGAYHRGRCSRADAELLCSLDCKALKQGQRWRGLDNVTALWKWDPNKRAEVYNSKNRVYIDDM